MFHIKIREARKAKGWTQQELADRMGLTQQAIQRYETGARDIRASVLQQLSETLGVTVAYLLGMTDDTVLDTGYVDVPLVNGDKGTPTVEGHYAIPIDLRRSWPNSFLMRIDDESMNHVLPHGCYALVSPCISIEYDGQPYALRIGDNAATIKRVRRTGDGLELRPDSTDTSFQPEIVDDTDALSIIGRVVWHCIPTDWSY